MCKSIVTFSRNSQADGKHEICSILNLRQSKNLGKHLGVPIIISLNKWQVFSDLVAKIKAKIDG